MAGEDIDVGDLAVPSSLGVGIALTTDPQMTRGLLEAFCVALGDATGIRVSPRGVASYARLVERIEEGDVDLVWLPPIPALRGTAEAQVTPIALPVRDGESSYRAALFCREDSVYRQVEDLHAVKAAWVDPHSAAGHLIVRAHLEREGHDLSELFGEDIFVGSHSAVANAVVQGRAEVGATYAYFDDDRVRRAGWGSAAVRVLSHAGPIPNDIIAARQGLSSILVRLVQSALVDVHNQQLRDAARALLNCDGFEVPNEAHLAPLRALLSGLRDAGAQSHSMYPPPPPPPGNDDP